MSLHKCFLCPSKSATLSDNAAKCTNCGAFYHPSCSKRGKPDAKNVFQACCGDKNTADTLIEEDKRGVEDLDPNSKLLFNLISKKIDNNYKQLEGSIDKIKHKILDIEGRLDKIEDNYFHFTEDIIAEIQDRMTRESNFIVYNLDDSKDAPSKDYQTIQNLLSNQSVSPPFNINDISVSRLGNKYINGKMRPLKVTLPSKEYVHWIYRNKKSLFSDELIISADSTRKQREYRSNVIKELKHRKESGEEGLFMKYIRGIPTIVIEESTNKNNAQASPARIKSSSDE